MQTLEKAVAFNPAYREAWRSYLGQMNQAQIVERLTLLTAGMDRESQQLCERQIGLITCLLPHPLLGYVYVSESAKQMMLPEKTRLALTNAGFFSDTQARLDIIQRELDLPVEPLPELLMHSGLKYFPSKARDAIGGKVVIDGGAYIGDTAKLFVLNYNAELVVAIEPDETNFEQLSNLTHHWGLQERILPHRAMLGDREGDGAIWGEGVGASAIKKVTSEDVRKQTVRQTSIDSISEELGLGQIGLIKLDVEGSEMATMLGARRVIERDRPLLLISLYHTAKDFFEIKPMLEEWGLGYRFLVRKITDDFIKELVLIGLPRDELV
jgi:FkbM family methyltransferase